MAHIFLWTLIYYDLYGTSCFLSLNLSMWNLNYVTIIKSLFIHIFMVYICICLNSHGMYLVSTIALAIRYKPYLVSCQQHSWRKTDSHHLITSPKRKKKNAGSSSDMVASHSHSHRYGGRRHGHGGMGSIFPGGNRVRLRPGMDAPRPSTRPCLVPKTEKFSER